MAAATEKEPIEYLHKENASGDDRISAEDGGVKDGAAKGEVEANHIDLPEAEARRILSKVDYRLVPMLALLYLVAFIDRSNSKSRALSNMTPEQQMPQRLTEVQSEMRRLRVSQRI